MTSDKGAISQFMETYYLHFNAAALVDAAKGYENQLAKGGKMLVSLADSFEELKNNVSWTERSELQRLVVIVLVFSILFSLAIWGADTVLSRVIQFYFNLIG